MLLDIKRMLSDHKIEGKNIYKGWVNVNCPFCGDPGLHGGFNLKGGYYTCFRCKYHWIVDAVANIFKVDRPTAGKILKEYSSGNVKDDETFEVMATKTDMPRQCSRMKQPHRDYLRKRGFDDRLLERQWGIVGTDYSGDYKFRIVAPIYLRNELVSYQGRDITDKQEEKYKACSKNECVLNLKHTLYGIDKVEGDAVVVVEGITDVWRLGYGAVATFGIDYTQPQIRMLCGYFKRFFILYDNEDNAQQMAREMGNQLGLLKREENVEIVNLPEHEDCGELSASEGIEVMKVLLDK